MLFYQRLSRRAFAGALSALCASVPRQAASQPPIAAEWADFRTRFLLPEGRIADSGNGGISHTEGQGWGMLFAEVCDDRQTFDLLHGWTRRTLQHATDALHAWRFRPGANGGVDEPNATDGDLFIAWALARAARRWQNPAYHEAAAAIARDILRLLIRRAGDLNVLLPGLRDFEASSDFVINPSYYVFPALRTLAETVPDPAWQMLEMDGLRLLRVARFGRWDLPPDWVTLSRNGAVPKLSGDWSARFGYDAVRVPLYLAWANLRQAPALHAALAFWDDPANGGRVAAWTDLRSDEVARDAAPEGVLAIRQLASGSTTAANLPRIGDAYDYYSASLTMLVHVAILDRNLAFQTR
ncbi:glycosyl hydrolase family 8 [Belnapia rosea]|uniref:glycosyl hydrolase family 8 n=1 Tax=Belnapia rosea TaxID=938405 RepID=UPI0015A4155E|nr:glycosyl hydrolase family 8 [Belnapia rosea]